MPQTAAPQELDECSENVNCYCPYFHRMIELVGRRWTGAIMLVLLTGQHHFGEIRHEIPGLSDRLLAERLTELVDAGLVERSSTGRTASYCLTDKGEGLRPTFEALEAFSKNWAESIDPAC